MKKCKYAVNIIIDQELIGGNKGSAVGCSLHNVSENQLVHPSKLNGVVCHPKCEHREEIEC